MTEAEIKEYLKSPLEIRKKVNALKECRRQCRERAECISGRLKGNDKSNSNHSVNGTEDSLTALLDSEEKLIAEIHRLTQNEKEVREFISNLHSDELETVLIHRYVLGHTLTQTSTLMFCSPETIKRKSTLAIKLLSKLTRCDPF